MIQLDETSPVFRKFIIPWYDSTGICLLIIFFMDLVFLFSAAGIAVARETPPYHRYLWLPVVLIVLSGGVIVSTTLRLIRRFAYRFRRSG